MKIIPTSDLPAYSQEVNLDGTPYKIFLIWNSVNTFWSISFFNTDDTPIICGLRLSVNHEVISWYPDRGLPKGEIWVVDTSGNETELERYDLVNGRANLIYITEEELETL